MVVLFAVNLVSQIGRCNMIWADKAEAMASYARQARDETLRKMADRIQARAIRRCGELLKQIEPAKNQYDASAREGAHPSTRTQAAESAGLSEHQRKTALRVASVPQHEFDAVKGRGRRKAASWSPMPLCAARRLLVVALAASQSRQKRRGRSCR